MLRSTTTGSGYSAVSGGSGLSGTTFTDSGLTRGTAYYYVVQATNSGGTSGNSNEAAADIINTSSPYYQIMREGLPSRRLPPTAISTRPSARLPSRTQSMSRRPIPPPQQSIKQIAMAAPGLLSPIPSLASRLTAAIRSGCIGRRTAWQAQGSEQFHVSVNGTQVLTNFDVFASAGAANKAVVRNFNATADGSGNITVSFVRGSANWAKINGLEIYSGSVTSTPSGLSVSATNAQNVLTWTAPSSGTATSYNLYRSTTASTEGSTPYQNRLDRHHLHRQRLDQRHYLLL